MTMLPQHNHQHLRTYLSVSYPCSYLTDQTACSQVIAPAGIVDHDLYSQLITLGFRRSGSLVYRPACVSCHQCMPLRIPVVKFRASKTQRKTWKRHSNLSARIMPLQMTDEYFSLYQNYQKIRHPHGGMDHDHEEEYLDFLGTSHIHTKVVAYRDRLTTNSVGILRMVSVIDMLEDGISAVYTYYDAQNLCASYGTYGILWQIDYAKALGLDYVYLGYWIKACSKMSYKTNFKPCEVLVNGNWLPLNLSAREPERL